MRNGIGHLIIGISIIIAVAIAACAFKYKYKVNDRVVVTGLAEKQFDSDLIVWNGWITQRSSDAADAFARLEEAKNKVFAYITSNGLPENEVVFMFVNTERLYDPIYDNGSYRGQRFTGYELRQQFTVESRNVELVEKISREISSLIAQGVNIESYRPDYYYSELDNLKQELIEVATQDARKRAEKIVGNAKGKIKSLANARLGVFQITGANTNEEFSAGGSFNTANKSKKARVTVRLEYQLK